MRRCRAVATPWYPKARATSKIRARVAGATTSGTLKARDAVAKDTPADSATCVNVTFTGRPLIKELWPILIDSAKSSAMILFIIATSTAFSWLFAYSGTSAQLVQTIQDMKLSPVMFVFFVAIVLLIFGTFLEGIATAVLMVPILWPVAQALGIDIIHFGMIVSISNVIGTMTPPVAVNIFAAASVSKLKIGEIARGQWPFFAGYVGVFFLVVFVPWFSTVLITR